MAESLHSNRKRDARKAAELLRSLGGLSNVQIIITLMIALVIAILFESIIRFGENLPSIISSDEDSASYHVLIAPLICALISFIILTIIISIFRNRLKNYTDDLEPITGVRTSESAKILILFLSSPNPRLSSEEFNAYRKLNQIDQIESTKRRLAALFPDGHSSFLEPDWVEDNIPQLNWRMPLMAIRHQLDISGSKLAEIVIIPSSDSPGFPGTHHYDELFRTIVTRALAARQRDVKVNRVADVASHELAYSSGRTTKTIDTTKGVPFDDFDAIVGSLYSLVKHYRNNNIDDDEILIDATGGKVLNSIAAAVFAILVKSRRFQYIDTETYSIRSFNIYHELDDFPKN